MPEAERPLLGVLPSASVARIGVICDREFLKPFDQRVWKEARTLADAGYDVEILTPHTHSEVQEVDGLTVRCVSTAGPPGATALRLLRLALRGRYDAYHCHELDPLLYALLLRPLTGKPVVWDCHEYMVPMKRELQGPLAAQLTALALEVAAPRASAIITVDNRLGRRLARYGRILVLPNYPRLANFPSVSSSRPDGPPVMLYVGSLTERRGILVMLEALRLLRKSLDVRLMIAGGFYDDNLEQKCRAFDREHDLQVEWLGWVDHRELAGVVSQASLGLSLLQPTERYLKGLPTKIFEYLIMGLPVLSARGPLLDRLIALSAAGLSIDSTSPATVAAGMRELLSRDDLATMASKGQHIARKLFTWDARQGKLPELYARLLQSS